MVFQEPSQSEVNEGTHGGADYRLVTLPQVVSLSWQSTERRFSSTVPLFGTGGAYDYERDFRSTYAALLLSAAA